MSKTPSFDESQREMTDDEIAYAACVLEQFDCPAREIDRYFRPKLRAHGRSKSTSDGQDVADQVCTDAIKEDERGRRPLVCQWRDSRARGLGGDLEGYLKSVVTNRLYADYRKGGKTVDWVPGAGLPGDSASKSKPDHDDASDDDGETAVHDDPRLHHTGKSANETTRMTKGAALAASIMLRAARSAARRYPRQMVCKWLVQNCGCQQRSMTVMLAPLRAAASPDVDEATISNWVKQAEEACLKPARDALSEGRISRREIAAAVYRWSDLLAWGVTAPLQTWTPDPGIKQSFARLVSGKIPAGERNAFVANLAAHPEQVRWLASLIRRGGSPRKEATETALAEPESDWRLRAPARLRGLHGQVVREALRSMHLLAPPEAGALLDEDDEAIFHLLRRATGAQTGTLWLVSADRRQLVAAFNPVEGANILGKAQHRHDGGIIWRVWDSGKPERVAIMEKHERHSQKMDECTGSRSQSMMAAPFRLFGETLGVLTLLRTGPDAPAFPLGELENAQRLSHLLATALEARLLDRALQRSGADARSTLRAIPALIAETTEHLLANLKAGELASVLPPGAQDMIALAARDIGAASGSLWLRHQPDEGGEQLMISLNAEEPCLHGHMQPSGQGIVGLSYRMNQPFCIEDVKAVKQWAGQAVDARAGRATLSMLAAPVTVHNHRAGAVTFVQHDESAPPLDVSSLGVAQTIARWTGRTLEARLFAELLSPLPNRKERK